MREKEEWIRFRRLLMLCFLLAQGETVPWSFQSVLVSCSQKETIFSTSKKKATEFSSVTMRVIRMSNLCCLFPSVIQSPAHRKSSPAEITDDLLKGLVNEGDIFKGDPVIPNFLPALLQCDLASPSIKRRSLLLLPWNRIWPVIPLTRWNAVWLPALLVTSVLTLWNLCHHA